MDTEPHSKALPLPHPQPRVEMKMRLPKSSVSEDKGLVGISLQSLAYILGFCLLMPGQPLRSTTLPHVFYFIVILSGKPWKGVLCRASVIYGVAGRVDGREALEEGGAAPSTAGYFRNGVWAGDRPRGVPSPP